MKLRILLTVCALLSLYAVPLRAADFVNVEDVLRELGKATEKAAREQERAREVARTSAITKLHKLAERAYREGNRTDETAAWKAVLSVDSENVRARKYFTDLGVLNDALKDASDPVKHNATAMSLIGKWRTRYNNEKSADFTVHPNGTVTYHFQGNVPNDQKLEIRDATIILPLPKDGVIERWTVAGDRLLIEQWYSNESLASKQPAPGFGYAVRMGK
jgi:hypothetical protein